MVHTTFSVQHFFSLSQQKIVPNGYVHLIIEKRSDFDDSVWGSSTIYGFEVVCMLPLNKYVMSQSREPSFVLLKSLHIFVIDIHFKIQS
jgi:hypothetical protein